MHNVQKANNCSSIRPQISVKIHFLVKQKICLYQVKAGEMDRACSTNVEKRNIYRILVRKPEGRRPLGRPRHRWVDNVKMDLR
jgi:hypothetical protein